jgi:hypothetical protein
VPNHRTGLLIIRAWLEEGSTDPLRAHVRVTGDVSAGIEHTITLVEANKVGELVDGWLNDILGTVAAAADR